MKIVISAALLLEVLKYIGSQLLSIASTFMVSDAWSHKHQF